MSGIDNIVSTYDGDKFVLSDKTYQEYEKWRTGLLRKIGEELASEFPKMYGKIEFNIQNGRMVNWNMKIGGK